MILKLDTELQVPQFILWHSHKWPLFPIVWITAFTTLIVPIAFSRNDTVGASI